MTQTVDEHEMSVIYTMKGAHKTIKVYEDHLTMEPNRSLLGYISAGMSGIKTIMFSSISSVQFKKPGLMNGYLSFTIPGGNEIHGLDVLGMMNDENTLILKPFNPQTQLSLEIKEYIENKVRDFQESRVPPQNSSMADELQKLADLKEKGILSEEEFQDAKHNLISGGNIKGNN